MSCSRLLNPKTQRLQFLPPRIPKRVNQLNLSIFARLPQSGGELSVNATKTGKIGHRQSIPLRLSLSPSTALFIALLMQYNSTLRPEDC